MSGRSKALYLYRDLLRTLQRWPSVRRDKVAAEIRAEFRQNQNESDPSKSAKMLADAEAGLQSLRQQCGLSAHGTEIAYAYDDALRRGQ
jgi:hypothetical protein